MLDNSGVRFVEAQFSITFPSSVSYLATTKYQVKVHSLRTACVNQICKVCFCAFESRNLQKQVCKGFFLKLGFTHKHTNNNC